MGNKRKKTAISSESDLEADDDSVFDDLSPESQKLVKYFERKVAKLLSEFKLQLESKDKRIATLEQEVCTLKRNVTSLENKMEDTEAYERRDTVIVSGSEVPVVTDGEDTSKVFCTLIKNKVKLMFKPTDISVAHRLGKKPSTQAPDRRSIIVKLCRRELKNDLLQACRATKPAGLYVNESLTQIRSTALYGLRQAKRKFPEFISGCGSKDGRVYVFIKPPNPSTPLAKNSRMFINTREKFGDLCRDVLKCNPSDFTINWPA